MKTHTESIWHMENPDAENSLCLVFFCLSLANAFTIAIVVVIIIVIVAVVAFTLSAFNILGKQ